MAKQEKSPRVVKSMVSLTADEAQRLKTFAAKRGMTLATALRVIALQAEQATR